MNVPLIEVKNLIKIYPIYKNVFSRKKKFIHAVNNISFKIFPQENVGLVGESGCGKTTMGRMMCRLEKPTNGYIFFNGKNIYRLKGKDLKDFRRNVQFIFQDPYLSLNPRKIVYNIISRGIRNFHLIKEKKIKEKISELLNQVGLSEDYLYNYPHEFSGGQQQRISIARSIAVKPAFIICDEPVSALDVSIQAQIINLLLILKKKYNLSMLFISHDLAVVKHISDRILVMYRGQIVETAPSGSLFENTAHPYTKALISAIPEPRPECIRPDTFRPDTYKRRIILKGDVTAANRLIKGCCFADRCYMVQDICTKEPPLGRQLIQGHTSYCHFAEKV